MIANEAVTLGVGVPLLLVRGGGSVNDKREVYIRSTLADLLVGGSGITAGNGLPIPANQVHAFVLMAGEDLYGFSATGGVVLVMATRSGSPIEVGN